MKQEDKELLLKDLCGRLPYGVKCNHESFTNIYTLYAVDSIHSSVNLSSDGLRFDDNWWNSIEQVKPYLFPMSSMTQKQQEEYGEYYDKDLANSAKNLYDRLDGIDVVDGYPMYNHIDWLNANHFDYRGLINKGLAIDATNLNIY